ncbi:MAG: GNAT family N-acetyltransferase, partial [Acutalibacteraceae bacterium]
KMQIRFVNDTDDLYEISNIYESSWKYAYKSIIPQDYLESIPKGRWANNIRKTGMNSLVLLENGHIIGTSSYCKSRFSDMSGYGEIVSVYLLPEYIGKGYGKHLLNASVNGLAEMGFNKVFLYVLEENIRARNFYEKFGFKSNGRYLSDNIGGKELKELQYEFYIN